VREVELAAYRIAHCALAIAGFAEFVDASGYRTDDAEHDDWSFVFGAGNLGFGLAASRLGL
jgi:hypothetical protein